ncbi:MAG: hypothetical protein WBA31_10015 [Candidatus Dormiibacterota bacterium]
MGPGEFLGLPMVPPQRLCSCAQRIRWSHLQYLGRGKSAPVYVCSGCGLVFRGRGEEGGRESAPAQRRRPLPAEGSPDNPVLDEEVAAKLRQLLSGP